MVIYFRSFSAARSVKTFSTTKSCRHFITGEQVTKSLDWHFKQLPMPERSTRAYEWPSKICWMVGLSQLDGSILYLPLTWSFFYFSRPKMFPSKSTFFSLNPNAFLILPGIGRGEFFSFFVTWQFLWLDWQFHYFKIIMGFYHLFLGLADAPPALRHMNSDASEDDVFMASSIVVLNIHMAHLCIFILDFGPANGANWSAAAFANVESSTTQSATTISCCSTSSNHLQ